MAKGQGKKKSGAGGFFLGAIVGTVIGGITGILTAPKSGKETRNDIKREGKKLKTKAQKTAAVAHKTMTQKANQFKKATSGKSSSKKTTKSKK